MPYKNEMFKLRGLQDRRKKLTDSDKIQIVQTFQAGGCTKADLARLYNVSPSLIRLIVDPEAAERVKTRRRENWKKYQVYGEERNRIQREHRKYKQQLYMKGELQ